MGHKKKHKKTKFPVETEHIVTMQKKYSAALDFEELIRLDQIPLPCVPARGLYIISFTLNVDRVIDAEHGTLAQELKKLSHLHSLDSIINKRS
jgi:hypothetical protein